MIFIQPAHLLYTAFVTFIHLQVSRIMAKSILFMTSRNNIKTKMQQTQIECSEINTHIIEITKIFVRFLLASLWLLKCVLDTF